MASANLMSRRYFFLILIALGLCPRVTGQEIASPQLRVLTYNIHHGEGMDGQFDYRRLAQIITRLKPHLVALQEVDNQTERARGVDQAARLGELTDMHYVFGNALYYSNGQYGEAILSRFPLKRPQAHHLPFRPGQEPRTALAVRVQPPGLPELIFVGTHLCHQSNETRIEQAQQINHLFPATGGPPVILAGDLNARPSSEPMNVLLTSHWVDAIAPNSRIDYILFRKGDPWKIVDVEIVDERVASDHKPVLAVLQWLGEVPGEQKSISR